MSAVAGWISQVGERGDGGAHDRGDRMREGTHCAPSMLRRAIGRTRTCGAEVGGDDAGAVAAHVAGPPPDADAPEARRQQDRAMAGRVHPHAHDAARGLRGRSGRASPASRRAHGGSRSAARARRTGRRRATRARSSRRRASPTSGSRRRARAGGSTCSSASPCLARWRLMARTIARSLPSRRGLAAAVAVIGGANSAAEQAARGKRQRCDGAHGNIPQRSETPPSPGSTFSEPIRAGRVLPKCSPSRPSDPTTRNEEGGPDRRQLGDNCTKSCTICRISARSSHGQWPASGTISTLVSPPSAPAIRPAHSGPR